MTDSGGNVAFVAGLTSAALGPWITATATDPAGNTSEFSACLAVPGPSVSSIAASSGPADVPTAVSIEGLNFQNGATVKIGGVAATGVAVLSGTQINASTPVLSPGTLNDVTVTNPSSLSGTISAGFLADFTDVPQANIFHDDVEKVFRAGITAGCGAGAFCVTSPVTRAQMAVFLLKAEHGLDLRRLRPARGSSPTCPARALHRLDRGSFSAEGITAGCGGDNYCPDNPVRRDQMAVFLLKTDHGCGLRAARLRRRLRRRALSRPLPDWIEQLYADGITGGCSTTPLLYCPGTPNTRGQMAMFLGNFGL